MIKQGVDNVFHCVIKASFTAAVNHLAVDTP